MQIRHLRKAAATSALILIALAAVISFAAYEIEFPDPPEGFNWKKIETIKAAFLMPDGWYFKAEKAKGTLGFFITAQDISSSGHFDTGLSINVKPRLKGTDAVDYAKNFAATMAKKHELVREWTSSAGVLKGFGCLTRNAGDKDKPTIMMATLAIGNETTNTLYVMWFESLESDWESAWQVGETIMQMFVLDDEV